MAVAGPQCRSCVMRSARLPILIAALQFAEIARSINVVEWNRATFWCLVCVPLALSLIVALLAIPAGFSGADDLHYVTAALRWLREGPVPGENHWETRLPYVGLLAGAFAIGGVSETTLFWVHSLVFVLALVLTVGIAREAFSARVALLAAWVFAFTPLFGQMPGAFGADGLEAVCGAASVLLCILHVRSDRVRPVLLLGAGMLGGLAIVVRQTAIAIPAALCLSFLMLDGNWARRLREIALLAVGHSLPLAGDILFNFVMTGELLYRLRVDLSHVRIPSAHMQGNVFIETSPLFNWQLAARWKVPSLIETHWALEPIVRLFSSPALLLQPLLGLVGTIRALRWRGAPRLLAALVLAGFALQYVLNTLVLVIAPSVRYFITCLLLLCPLAAFLLDRLGGWRSHAALAFAIVVPGILITSTTPTTGPVTRNIAAWIDGSEPVHATNNAKSRMALMRLERPEIDRALLEGEPPVGGLMIWDPFTMPEARLADTCPDGSLVWQPVAAVQPRSLIWQAIMGLGLDGLLPQTVRVFLRQDNVRAALLRRRC